MYKAFSILFKSVPLARLSLFLVLTYACSLSHAQLGPDYHPLQLSGEIPADLLNRVKSQTAIDLNNRDKALTEQEGRKFYAISNYAFNQAVHSGQVYFNDEFTLYLNSILDKLLVNDPELRSSVRVYTSRISIPNASSWRNGVILFNVPLFFYMTSEAQIAFILAHEITHYKRKHNFKQFKKKLDIKKSVRNNAKAVDELFELMKFSREHELEADLHAFELLLETDYDPKEAISALKQLKQIDSSSTQITKSLKDIFQINDTSLVYESPCEQEKKEEKEKKEDLYYLGFEEEDKVFKKKKKREKEKKEEEIERLRSHPNIDQRIAALEKELKASAKTKEGSLFIQSEQFFEEIREKAYIEQIQNAYDNGYYASSLYMALQMSAQYPDNVYLQEISTKNMYWLSKFIKDEKKKAVLPNYKSQNGSFALFCCYLNSLGTDGMLEFAEIFMEDRYQKFPLSEKISISLAKLYFLKDEKTAARRAFESHLEKFPNGSTSKYAKIQLEKL